MKSIPTTREKGQYLQGEQFTITSENVHIEVKGGGWSLATHNKNVFELIANGRTYSRVSVERGSFDLHTLAKILHTFAENEEFDNYYSVDEYTEILKLYYNFK